MIKSLKDEKMYYTVKEKLIFSMQIIIILSDELYYYNPFILDAF